jgi:PTH1 family peptidyl-tRNA hydrolase
MNLSGKAIGALSKFYQIAPQSILVAHDELDLPPGVTRFKKGGGHGGHNGLRDTIQRVGNSRDFARIRVGIGHPGQANLVTDYVLKKASPNDFQLIANSIDAALQHLDLAVDGQWEKALRALHSN